jgi:hypothetical protein
VDFATSNAQVVSSTAAGVVSTRKESAGVLQITVYQVFEGITAIEAASIFLQKYGSDRAEPCDEGFARMLSRRCVGTHAYTVQYDTKPTSTSPIFVAVDYKFTQNGAPFRASVTFTSASSSLNPTSYGFTLARIDYIYDGTYDRRSSGDVERAKAGM